MSRSSRRIAAALAGAAVLAALPAGADAQAPTVAVSDLELPVVDLQLPVASLDQSLRRVETGGEVRLTLAADVLFAFDSARLSSQARDRVEAAAAEIDRIGPGRVSIEGHTDSKGADAYNRGLSRRRAESVREALARTVDGVPRLEATGRGEDEPVASNTEEDGSDDPAGRARNRRVEIRIPKR